MRGADQPIQLVLRVANLFLWKLATQNVEGILEGIAKEDFRIIQDELGADEYIDNAEEVKRLFTARSEECFARYGAAIDRINIAKAVPKTEGWIANAIAQSGNRETGAIAGAIHTSQTNGQPASS